MKYRFTDTIKIIGINPYVIVPKNITDQMEPVKGYIPVKGKINAHPFIQTLVPVKNAEYRLYVNGPMLKGSKTKLGDVVKFIIEQDFDERKVPMHPQLKKALKKNKLENTFTSLTPGRQKEILKYLSFLKTPEAIERNIKKIIGQLQLRSKG
jgi:hypothetical protein